MRCSKHFPTHYFGPPKEEPPRSPLFKASSCVSGFPSAQQMACGKLRGLKNASLAEIANFLSSEVQERWAISAEADLGVIPMGWGRLSHPPKKKDIKKKKKTSN